MEGQMHFYILTDSSPFAPFTLPAKMYECACFPTALLNEYVDDLLDFLPNCWKQVGISV